MTFRTIEIVNEILSPRTSYRVNQILKISLDILLFLGGHKKKGGKDDEEGKKGK